MSEYLFTVNNDPIGHQRIKNLRKNLRGSDCRIVLYGRHKNRKQLAIDLVNSGNPWTAIPSSPGFSMTVDYAHLSLRRGVPLKFAQTIRVYLKRRQVS